MKKYELLEREENGLCRIRALIDIPRHAVRAGDIGGYVESENNLSHEGTCWIFGDAEVCDRGLVTGGALVCNHTRVSGYAIIADFSRISGYARILGHARVQDESHVFGRAQISDHAEAYDRAEVFGGADIGGYVRVCCDAQIYGGAHTAGVARISKGARVASSNDILVAQQIGSRRGTTTFYRTEEGISVTCGCFTGALDEFRARVARAHGNNKYAREYELACRLAELHILGEECRKVLKEEA